LPNITILLVETTLACATKKFFFAAARANDKGLWKNCQDCTFSVLYGNPERTLAEDFGLTKLFDNSLYRQIKTRLELILETRKMLKNMSSQ